MNSKNIDYSAAYNDFWARDDRIGSDSYPNIDDLIEQIVATVGYGRVLDIGCGEGRLVRALIEKGVDAYGIDVSSVAINRATQYCPGRFQCASVIDLPFTDHYFDAIVSTDCLEHIDPNDVPIAIAELRRICSQYAFFTIATTIDREEHWHLTVKPRKWWEERFFEAGFIRHPEYYKLNSLNHIASEPWQITLPLSTVCANLHAHNLSPKYLRDVELSADIILSCYTSISDLARPGDLVFHVGAPSSDFSFLMYSRAERNEIHVFLAETEGVVSSQEYVDFKNIRFHSLAGLPKIIEEYSGKISFVVVESGFTEQAKSILSNGSLVPGGRVIYISELEGVADNKSNNPVPENFTLEETQYLEFFSLRASFSVYLSSFDSKQDEFIPRLHGYASPPANLINFVRDYSNPWLLQNLVVPGVRTSNIEILTQESKLIIQRRNIETSADFGAALCVFGYRMLDHNVTADIISPFIRRIDDYLAAVDFDGISPHCQRWVISLKYLQARLFLKMGNIEFAIASFRSVVSKNALAFSPTLVTKIISSFTFIGDAALGNHQINDAAAAYEKGVNAGFSALNAQPSEWIGRWELPIKGAMYEAVQIADLTNICLLKLRALKLSTDFGHPMLRVFHADKDSVFTVSSKRFSIIKKQNSQLQELALAINAQAQMLEERWTAMQSMEASIRERDAAISGQAQMLEERWLAMQSMEASIRERDVAISGQAQMLEERWLAMQSMEASIRERDLAISGQAQMLEERWLAMQSMEASIRERDVAVSELQNLIEKLPTPTEAVLILIAALRASLGQRIGRLFGINR